LEDKRREDNSPPELGVRACLPLVLNHAERDQENKEIDRIKAGETGEPEVALRKRIAAVGVVVGENVPGDEEEDSDKNIAVVDKWVEKTEVRRREMEQNDEDCKQCADAGECGQRWLADVNVSESRSGWLWNLCPGLCLVLGLGR
jgi:hypothetical protein